MTTPMLEPPLLGLTTQGIGKWSESKGTPLRATAQSAVRMPSLRRSDLLTALSIASAQPIEGLPVYGISQRSKNDWRLPFSPTPPCNARNVRSAARQSSSTPEPICSENPPALALRTCARFGSASGTEKGGRKPSTANACSMGFGSGSIPKNKSIKMALCPCLRRALVTMVPVESDTSRSGDRPPARTTMFICVSFPIRESVHRKGFPVFRKNRSYVYTMI